MKLLSNLLKYKRVKHAWTCWLKSTDSFWGQNGSKRIICKLLFDKWVDIQIKKITSLLRLPSVMEILVTIPYGIIPSFLYVLDFVKDSIQLLLLIYAVHGLWYALKNWYSFSSVVSIIEPIWNHLGLNSWVKNHNLTHRFTYFWSESQVFLFFQKDGLLESV